MTTVPETNFTRRKTPEGRMRAAFLIMALSTFCIMAAGCARYAPVPPPPPKDKLLKILLYTKAPISNDFYYYIAIDLSQDPDSFGPQPYFAGIHTAENWDYYVRFNQGIFTENTIASTQDIFQEPNYFNVTSPRYYSASQTSGSLIVRIYLDRLKAGKYNMKLNFITSREPLKDEYDIADEDIVVDYLKNTTETTFSISNTKGDIVYANDYPNLNKAITEEADYPADINNWIVEIEEI